MINVSSADKAKWENGNEFKQIIVNFPQLNMTYGNDDVYEESLTLDEGVFDGNDALCVYGCISSKLTISIRRPSKSPEGELYPADSVFPGRITSDLKGTKIEVSIKAGDSAAVPIFNGYVESVETDHGSRRQNLVCYDYIGRIQDANVAPILGQLNYPCTMADIRDTLFDYIGIDQVETTLANDSVTVSEPIEDEEISVMSALKALCEINGIFGIVNRDEEFEYRELSYWYDFLPYPSDDLYPNDELFPGTVDDSNHAYLDSYENLTFEDYKIEYINRVVLRDNTGDAESGQPQVDSNTLVIENNLFATHMSAANKAIAAGNLLNSVKAITYTPFESLSRGLPYIEAGDSVTYYAYDCSGGTPTAVVMTFNVLKRSLSGIQWLKDRYSASGMQYQPAIKMKSPTEESMQNDINNLKNEVEEIAEDLRHKQNFIDKDILVPSGSGTEGDLCWYDVPGLNCKALYRYEDNDWKMVKVVGTNTTPPTGGEDGVVYFENNGAHITGIWMNIDGAWLDWVSQYGHLVNYSTDEQNTEVLYLDGKLIFQKSYIFNTPVSLASETWTDVVQDNIIGRIAAVEGSNADGDMIALIGKVNGNYAQVMTLQSAAQSLKYLTLRYTKANGVYVFNQDYHVNETYSFDAASDLRSFIVDFFTAVNTYNSGSFDSGCTAYALAHINDIINYINSKNVDNKQAIGVMLNGGGAGSHTYMYFYFQFLELGGSYKVNSISMNHGYKNAELSDCVLANGKGSMGFYPSSYDTSDNQPYGSGYFAFAGINMQGWQWRGSNVGIHYV